ncbi:hypothetical protein [Microbacterium sp. YY-01]|uniref:hypothetical protein n=1 Tax=Microbacterium sp. YY-01 TaxID=3421634 RepID=UPI003D180CBB
MNVEVKNLLRPYPGIVEVLLASIAQSHMSDRIVVSSFHHRLLRELREQDRQVALAALYADGLIDPWVYMERIGVSEVHPH